MDTDDAEHAPGDPERSPDTAPQPDTFAPPGTAAHADTASRSGPDIADEALDAMARAVASLRDQAARMINTALPPPAPPAQDPDPPADT